MTERIAYYDGAGASRTARLERQAGGGVLVLTVAGQLHRLPVATATTARGGGVAAHVGTVAALAAYALLARFKARRAAYGARVALRDGTRCYVALYQEHPPDAGKAYPHPGVTLLDAPADLIPPEGSARRSSALPLLLVASAAAYLLTR